MQAGIGGEPFEQRCEWKPIAVGCGEAVDERVEGRTQRHRQATERVGEPGTTLDLTEHIGGGVAQRRCEMVVHGVKGRKG